jgi:hypothetical protein
MAINHSPHPSKHHWIFDFLNAAVSKMFFFLLLAVPFTYAEKAFRDPNIATVQDLAHGLQILCSALAIAVLFFSVSHIVGREELRELTDTIQEQNERWRRLESKANGFRGDDVNRSRETMS